MYSNLMRYTKLMKTMVDYIEKLKEMYGLNSYYKAMSYIGMNVQGWTKIKAGGGISEKNAIRLAQALKIDPIEIMAVSNALKAENNEIKMVWIKLARQKEEERENAKKYGALLRRKDDIKN